MPVSYNEVTKVFTVTGCETEEERRIEFAAHLTNMLREKGIDIPLGFGWQILEDQNS